MSRVVNLMVRPEQGNIKGGGGVVKGPLRDLRKHRGW